VRGALGARRQAVQRIRGGGPLLGGGALASGTASASAWVTEVQAGQRVVATN